MKGNEERLWGGAPGKGGVWRGGGLQRTGENKERKKRAETGKKKTERQERETRGEKTNTDLDRPLKPSGSPNSTIENVIAGQHACHNRSSRCICVCGVTTAPPSVGHQYDSRVVLTSSAALPSG